METITKTVIVPEKIIPEHTKEVTKYVAFDGMEFDDFYKCKIHERELNMKKEKVVQSCINNQELTDFTENYNAKFYYLSSIKDIETLENFGIIMTFKPNVYTVQKYGDKAKNYKYDILHCDFELHGPGWYMVYWINDEDYSNNCYVLNFKHYINKIKSQLVKYEERTKNIIEDKEVELKMQGWYNFV